MDIPRLTRHIAAGQLPQALRVVKARIALPSVFGRICPAPCEKACRRGKIDRPVAICMLKRIAGDADLAGEPWQPKAAPTGRRITIVGGGPAGLSAAWFALKMGYACTLIEAAGRLGGGLTNVEPSRLGPDVLERELGVLRAMGLQVQVGRSVVTADDLAALRHDADAVLLACGKLTAEQAEGLGLAWAGHGFKIDADHRTSLAGVFAAGAAAGVGARMAVRSGADALAAVEAIDAWMKGVAAVHGRPWTCHMGAASPDELTRMLAAGASDSPQRCDEPGAQATGRDCLAPELEARRCLHCDCGKAG